MNVNEIFSSIDGEGVRAGELATFIRLAGCNLRCSYCDTAYALKNTDGKSMSIDEIVNTAKEYGVKNITLTGGEPLIHKGVKELIHALLEQGFEVNIETNGSVDITPYLLPNVIVTMDYKTASSGENAKMMLKNIEKLRESDVLKFVLSRNDFKELENILRMYQPNCFIYLSPIFGKIEASEIVEQMKEMQEKGFDMSKTRVQLQMHKFIWNPDERGV